MARKTRTKKGRAAYARRKAIVEAVFGQMTILKGARDLLLRGEDAPHPFDPGVVQDRVG